VSAANIRVADKRFSRALEFSADKQKSRERIDLTNVFRAYYNAEETFLVLKTRFVEQKEEVLVKIIEATYVGKDL
jgi:hypothetical protein